MSGPGSQYTGIPAGTIRVSVEHRRSAKRDALQNRSVTILINRYGQYKLIGKFSDQNDLDI